MQSLLTPILPLPSPAPTKLTDIPAAYRRPAHPSGPICHHISVPIPLPSLSLSSHITHRYPSCLQTTCASLRSHLSSHISPHSPSLPLPLLPHNSQISQLSTDDLRIPQVPSVITYQSPFPFPPSPSPPT